MVETECHVVVRELESVE